MGGVGIESVFADSFFSLSHGVLPFYIDYFEVFVPFSYGGAVVVGEYEWSLVFCEEVFEELVVEVVVVDGEVSLWVYAFEHFAVSVEVIGGI